MKTVKQHLVLLAFLLAAATVRAQGPNGSGTYYKNANGQSGQALKTALAKILNNQTINIGYDGLIEAYKETDMRPDGYLRDWYSNATSYTWSNRNGNSSEGAGWNREHAVPQSWFGKGNPMRADIVHVIPTDSYVNNRRGSYPFGEVGSVTWQSKNGYSKVGSCKTAGYSGTVFEPNDAIKGDIARIYFYMVTRYEDKCTSWGNKVFASSKYPGLEQWVLDMLMRWAKQDPVDEVETARNKAVYGVQFNRNPYVDYPGLEDYVWGSKKDEPFVYDGYEPADGGDSGSGGQGGQGGGQGGEEPDSGGQGGSGASEQPADGSILLNSDFFHYEGSNPTISSNVPDDLTGTQHGITVVYALGSGGSNRYCSNSQIRLYQKNTLTVSVAGSLLADIVFTPAETPQKQLQATTGTVDGMHWTGSAASVTFTVGDGSGHLKLSAIDVHLQNTAVALPVASPRADRIYNLQGQPVSHPAGGLYIVGGKKVVVSRP